MEINPSAMDNKSLISTIRSLRIRLQKETSKELISYNLVCCVKHLLMTFRHKALKNISCYNPSQTIILCNGFISLARTIIQEINCMADTGTLRYEIEQYKKIITMYDELLHSNV